MIGNIFIANLISMVAFSAVNYRSYQQVNFKINSLIHSFGQSVRPCQISTAWVKLY